MVCFVMSSPAKSRSSVGMDISSTAETTSTPASKILKRPCRFARHIEFRLQTGNGLLAIKHRHILDQLNIRFILYLNRRRFSCYSSNSANVQGWEGSDATLYVHPRWISEPTPTSSKRARVVYHQNILYFHLERQHCSAQHVRTV